jgi:hypothetical protein
MAEVSPAGVSLVHEAAPWRCAPCNEGRWGASLTPLIILVLVALNYIPVVLFGLDFSPDGGRITLLVLFHLLLLMMTMSYLMVMFTDPGTPTQEWQRTMAAAVGRGEHVPVCRKSGLYKPPRSHFDSVTERLTLNMDHFCPWVVNTVGFYNRKFFILFLIYANGTAGFSAIVNLAYVAAMWPWLNSAEAQRAWFPAVVNPALYIGAIVVDVVLLCVLAPFAAFHLNMARKNETTIEGGTNAKYDVGVMQNLRSVFGKEVWTWPIPLYLNGPDGDGLHWPSRDQPIASSSGTSTSTIVAVSAASSIASPA